MSRCVNLLIFYYSMYFVYFLDYMDLFSGSTLTEGIGDGDSQENHGTLVFGLSYFLFVVRY